MTSSSVILGIHNHIFALYDQQGLIHLSLLILRAYLRVDPKVCVCVGGGGVRKCHISNWW